MFSKALLDMAFFMSGTRIPLFAYTCIFMSSGIKPKSLTSVLSMISSMSGANPFSMSLGLTLFTISRTSSVLSPYIKAAALPASLIAVISGVVITIEAFDILAKLLTVNPIPDGQSMIIIS